MQKTILLTGATDGIGFETAKVLLGLGHRVLIHGRNPEKIATTKRLLSEQFDAALIESYIADLSNLNDVVTLSTNISAAHQHLDVVINNAGVFNVPDPLTRDNLDVRFVVNTLAPYMLTKKLLPLMNNNGRIINLSSAAQAPVNLRAMEGHIQLSASEAYAQSKLAITMWTASLARSTNSNGPVLVSVNPASMLGSKMVKEAYGVDGGDLSRGADILKRAALDDEFANASGKYFDNDIGQFSDPHHDALDNNKCDAVVMTIENLIKKVADSA